MRRACITGASSGIGAEFARQLSARGYSLILVARNRERLEELASEAGPDAEVICCDLSDEDECRKLVEVLAARDIDLLINNAGFGSIGSFAELDEDRELAMIDVNVKALHILCRGLLPSFIERNSGYILNVASVAGLMHGGPYMATYYATKAFVASFTASVGTELREAGSRVRISALCPGPVDTRFNENAGVRFALHGISAEKCVSYCLKKMENGRSVIIPGMPVRIGSVFYRIFPRRAQLFFTGRAQKSKKG